MSSSSSIAVVVEEQFVYPRCRYMGRWQFRNGLRRGNMWEKSWHEVAISNFRQLLGFLSSIDCFYLVLLRIFEPHWPCGLLWYLFQKEYTYGNVKQPPHIETTWRLRSIAYCSERGTSQQDLFTIFLLILLYLSRYFRYFFVLVFKCRYHHDYHKISWYLSCFKIKSYANLLGTQNLALQRQFCHQNIMDFHFNLKVHFHNLNIIY